MLTLTKRPSNDLTRLPNALSTTALHPRPLPIVLNSSKQPGTVGDTSTKFTDLSGPSKTHPRSFLASLRLHKTFPDHQGRERSAVRSAKCDRGFNEWSFSYLHPWLRMKKSGPCFNIKTILWVFFFFYADKKIMKLSYLYNGNAYSDKTTLFILLRHSQVSRVQIGNCTLPNFILIYDFLPMLYNPIFCTHSQS